MSEIVLPGVTNVCPGFMMVFEISFAPVYLGLLSVFSMLV